MELILPDDLISFNLFTSTHPIEVDLSYANAQHPENLFGQIYHPKARMWGHIDLVTLTLFAALILRKNHNWTLVVKDCLRPIEAQQKMIETDIVRTHPHWLEEPRFLSSPGQGGHPRGMAVDIAAKDANGHDIDFGTAFDAFSDRPDAENNPAHREYVNLAPSIKSNRECLNQAMAISASRMGKELVFLSTEWWDFRFTAEWISKFEPISDVRLEQWQKMVSAPIPIPEDKAKDIHLRVFDRLDKLGDF
ncbi:MAG: D-Ala-D-Ala dipeptidase [Alphaproteobacteria bacterium]|jgi:D-alanyl-D-alanine dipeptidase|nr:D-Ala-D-Ala dipeptidase [Alphaproteobacteria bacterium]